jgi:hypothetical protein
MASVKLQTKSVTIDDSEIVSEQSTDIFFPAVLHIIPQIETEGKTLTEIFNYSKNKCQNCGEQMVDNQCLSCSGA